MQAGVLGERLLREAADAAQLAHALAERAPPLPHPCRPFARHLTGGTLGLLMTMYRHSISSIPERGRAGSPNGGDLDKLNPAHFPNWLRIALIALSGVWLVTIPFMFWRKARYTWLPYAGAATIVLTALGAVAGGVSEEPEPAATANPQPPAAARETAEATAPPTSQPSPTPTPTSTPAPEPTLTPTSTLTPEPPPTSTPDPTPEPTPEPMSAPTPEPPDYARECAGAEALVHEFIKGLVPGIAITPDGDCSQAQARGALPAYIRTDGHGRDPQGAIWFIQHYYGDGSYDQCHVWLSEAEGSAEWFGEDHMRITWCRSSGPVTQDIR